MLIMWYVSFLHLWCLMWCKFRLVLLFKLNEMLQIYVWIVTTLVRITENEYCLLLRFGFSRLFPSTNDECGEKSENQSSIFLTMERSRSALSGGERLQSCFCILLKRRRKLGGGSHVRLRRRAVSRNHICVAHELEIRFRRRITSGCFRTTSGCRRRISSCWYISGGRWSVSGCWQWCFGADDSVAAAVLTCCRCLVVVDRVVVVVVVAVNEVNEVLNVESLAVDVDLFSDDLTVHVRRQLAVEDAGESGTILKLIFKRVQENQISVLKKQICIF